MCRSREREGSVNGIKIPTVSGGPRSLEETFSRIIYADRRAFSGIRVRRTHTARTPSITVAHQGSNKNTDNEGGRE